ncbi:MAG: hypothetical protein KAJ54_00295 [Candidatus Aenigmarchaeota archaeon]|nr:hypothetical protein [Candidatus Aenigmarchaeota archaeon]MCK5322003.1 hypothetical protein [Candidatus Aenigmarchaeota archaeon]
MGEIDVSEYVENGWISAWFIFDTQAIDKKVVKEILEKMMKQFGKEEGMKVVSESYSKVKKTEPVPQLKKQGVDSVYSIMLEVELVAKDFETLLRLVMTYGPTALEIIEPDEIKLSMRSAQNALLSVSEMMHRFAIAVQGGVKIKNN